MGNCLEVLGGKSKFADSLLIGNLGANSKCFK